MPTLTVMVLTHNESEMIRLCLDRLRWADELLVIDSFSEDDTRELAAALGAKVLTHPFRNFSDQCNWGLARASGDWILQIDADELATPELRDSVLRVVASNPPEEIFSLERDSYVFGRLMKSSSWSGEWIPRLFRRGAVTFAGEVHQDPQVGGRPVGKLEGKLIHYTYRSTRKYFEKFELYSTLWAEKAFANGRRTTIPKAVAGSVWRVFHNYFIRGEIRDGAVGFVIAVLGGMHTFMRHMKLWGLQNAERFGRVYEEDSDGADRR